jgi:type IV secretion system protein VirB1
MILTSAAILALAQQCSPNVAPISMQTLIAQESSGNPYAIGVVGMELVSQPKTRAEAISVAQSLLEQGENISVGLAQVNKNNFKGLGLTLEKAFNACENVAAGARILQGCYTRYAEQMGEGQEALAAAYSCYYSNNEKRGFEKEGPDQHSYVMKIAMNSEKLKGVPPIEFKPKDIKETDPQQKTGAQPAVSKKENETEPPKRRRQKEGSAETLSWDVLGDFEE